MDEVWREPLLIFLAVLAVCGVVLPIALRVLLSWDDLDDDTEGGPRWDLLERGRRSMRRRRERKRRRRP